MTPSYPSAQRGLGIWGAEGGLNAGVDVFEPIVKNRFGNPVVIELEQSRKEGTGSLLFDDPLFVQHHDMGNINEYICIGQVPVSFHR